MRKLDGGVWEAVSAYAKEGQAYKYCVQGRSGRTVYKTDPYGNRCCALPETSSIIDPPDGFCWHDSAYRARMAKQSAIRGRSISTRSTPDPGSGTTTAAT